MSRISLFFLFLLSIIVLHNSTRISHNVSQLNLLSVDFQYLNNQIIKFKHPINTFIIDNEYIELSPQCMYLYNTYSKKVSNPLVKNLWWLKQLDFYVDKYAKKYKLPKELVFAIIHIESSFNQFLVSSKSCYGLMQVNYPVWKSALKINHVGELLTMDTNLKYGVRILKHYIEKCHNDYKEGIMSYFGRSSYAKKYYQKVWSKYLFYKALSGNKNN